ncbi:exosortase/archaeosortase family protein [Viscerimonas tarda]
MKSHIRVLHNEIKPYKDIIWFLFLFISFDFLWKLFVSTDEEETEKLFFLSKDITNLTKPFSVWTAQATYWIVNHVLGFHDLTISGALLYFDHPITYQDFVSETSMRLRIVWDCTGIKQMIQFALIIVCCFGPLKKKLWYIPLSIVILSLINILRIMTSALLIKDGFPDWFIPFNEWYNHAQWQDAPNSYRTFYNDWFQLFHKDVFKWLYYNGVIFILWLVWQEKCNIPYQRRKKNRSIPEKRR